MKTEGHMFSASEAEARATKLRMLAVMLAKLSQLYPQFADEVEWEEAHELLADFCVTPELRNTTTHLSYPLDEYYIHKVARQLGITHAEVYVNFAEVYGSMEFKQKLFYDESFPANSTVHPSTP